MRAPMLDPKQKAKIKHLKANMTKAECILWQRIRRKQINGYSFRRQYPIGPYIVDFYNSPNRLAIECDGGQHNESKADIKRDHYLVSQRVTVLRFWNHEIIQELDSVIQSIELSLI